MGEIETEKHFHLFNCDKTYDLAPVQSLLSETKDKLGFDFSVTQHYFDLPKMSEMCESIISEPQMDFAIFVVHAHESRLSINEENAGIGYAKIYKTLQQKTGDNVIIVIGGDDNYKDEDEENRVVLSRWAWRKISSQFNEECLDGRQSFIFSWNKKHREIHKEAMLHYFDPSKKGKKFEPQPKVKISTQSDFPADVAATSQKDEVEVVNELDEKPTEQRGSTADHRERHTGDEPAATEVTTGEPHLNYPEGTVLLETRLRFGELSYDEDDLVRRENSWYPPQEIRQSLKQRYGSTPEAELKLVVRDNRVVQNVRRSWWQAFWKYCTIV